MPRDAPTGVILVVDHHASFRAVVRRHLQGLGHTVLEAGDGAEALHLVRRRNGVLDLILSDVVMPRMHGTDLAIRIGSEFPGIPVVLMSGFLVGEAARVGLGDSIVPVLRKPFDAAQLGELVELALRHPVSPRVEERVRSV